MESFKISLKKWLKENRKDRFWLAEQCGVEKKTVDKWFEKVGVIPELKIKWIKKILNEKHEELKSLEELPNIKELGKIFLALEPETQRLVENEAHRMGLTVTAYCSLAVEYCADDPQMSHELLALLNTKKNPVKSAPEHPHSGSLSSAG